MTDPSKTDNKPVDELGRIRDIVLGEEKDRLHTLERRVSDLESRTSDVAEVLPAAMDRLVGDPASLPDIEKPVVTTIRGAIKRDTESFAQALFPVLGPAIRRAVADALKGMVQRINAALENSFTIKGLKWRLEAARTGVPFAQIVLRHTMLYAVQEAFLIQRGSGLILASVHRDEMLTLDEDAVAAMLTAIQSFIQDSFGLSADEPLRSAELGDRTMWVINGPSALLACVISGTPPREVRDELMLLLETLHARYGKELDGDAARLAGDDGLSAVMDQALREEVDEEAGGGNSKRSWILWSAAGVALLVYLLLSTVNAWRDRQFAHQVENLFHVQPGYVITAAEMNDGVIQLAGLRDPESEHPAVLLDSGQIDSGRVITDFSPYQSLDPELVTRRLARRLALDSSVTLGLDGDALSVSGPLNSRQLANLQSLPQFHPLIRRVDLAAVRLEVSEATAMFREALEAPESVSFLASGDSLGVSGSAHAEWYTTARDTDVNVPGWQLDFRPMEKNLGALLDATIERLDGHVFHFLDGYELTTSSQAGLSAVAADLAQVQEVSEALNVTLAIRLEGSSDGVGTQAKNSEVSLRRSRHVLTELVAQGADEGGIVLTRANWQQGNSDPGRRKVTMSVTRPDG